MCRVLSRASYSSQYIRVRSGDDTSGSQVGGYDIRTGSGSADADGLAPRGRVGERRHDAVLAAAGCAQGERPGERRLARPGLAPAAAGAALEHELGLPDALAGDV